MADSLSTGIPQHGPAGRSAEVKRSEGTIRRTFLYKNKASSDWTKDALSR